MLWTPSTVLDQLRNLLAEVGRVNAAASWRTIITDSESETGIAPACTSPDHPKDEGHWVRECCPGGDIELYQTQMAAFVVAALVWMPPMLAELRAGRAARSAGTTSPAGLHSLIARAISTADAVQPELSAQEAGALATAVVQALATATTQELLHDEHPASEGAARSV